MKKVFKLQGHEKPVNVVKINFDGDLIFSASSDKKINVWNSLSGELLGDFICKGASKTIDITKDTKYLFVASLNSIVECFDINTKQNIGIMQRNSKCRYMELSYDNKFLLIYYESMLKGGDSIIKIYEVSSLIQYLSTYKPDSNLPEEKCPVKSELNMKLLKLTQVSWSLLDEYLIASSEEGEMMHIDRDTGIIIKRDKVSTSMIKSFSISKDFSMLLTAGEEGGKLLDPNTFKVLRKFRFEVQMNCSAISPLATCKTNPKFHCILAGGIGAREAALVKQSGFDIHLCNLMYEKEIGTIAGHFGPVNSVAFHQDGRGFVTAGEEGNLRLHRFSDQYMEDKLFE